MLFLIGIEFIVKRSKNILIGKEIKPVTAKTYNFIIFIITKGVYENILLNI
jgi:hypothetical protein